MNKKITLMSLTVVVAFLVVGGVYYVAARRAQPTPEVDVRIAPTPEVRTMVRLTYPQANDAIGTPYTFSGEARGTWFFEASFPVRVEDANGNTLGRGIAQAGGEWMTEEFVPFSGTVDFVSEKDQSGRMVFEKDNPSGLPVHDDEFSVSVQLQKTNATRLKVFFLNTFIDPNVVNCERVYPTERSVPKTQSVARVAIDELLAGPTEDEKAKGFVTSMNTEPRPVLNRIEIKSRVAHVDFNDAFNFQVGGSCRVQAIRAQVEETLKQFPTIDRVVISVNGQTESILEP